MPIVVKVHPYYRIFGIFMMSGNRADFYTHLAIARKISNPKTLSYTDDCRYVANATSDEILYETMQGGQLFEAGEGVGREVRGARQVGRLGQKRNDDQHRQPS